MIPWLIRAALIELEVPRDRIWTHYENRLFAPNETSDDSADAIRYTQTINKLDIDVIVIESRTKLPESAILLDFRSLYPGTSLKM